MKKIIAAIKIGLENKVTSVQINGSKKIMNNLKMLETEGLIRGFQILNFETYKLSILLKYKENLEPLIKNIKSVSETKERLYLKGKILNRHQDDMNVHYLTTKIGLLKARELKEQNKYLKNKLGGEYKYRVEFNEMYSPYKTLSKK